jgi:hypothetical protein
MQNKINKKITTLGIQTGVFWKRIFPLGKFPKWKKSFWKISGNFPEFFHFSNWKFSTPQHYL